MSIIGTALPRSDAFSKVTGESHYPADLVKPDMYQLQVVFALRPHARILAIDTSEALAQPDVIAVLTARDVPYNAFGLIEADQPVLCDDVVRFEGDKVAVVVARTKQAAIRGAQYVRVTYEDLPAVTDVHTALAPDAPLVHQERGSNQLFHFPLRKGDTHQGFAQADVVLEETFTTSWQEHAFLQPEAGMAYIDEQGRVVIVSAGQWLHEDRRQIAAILELPEESVIVRYAAIGGAFGGREDLSIQHLLALAAWKLRHPVALVWSREESIIAHHKRHPVHIYCRWGATRAGQITAVKAKAIADGGAYASTSVEVVKDIAVFVTGAYEIPNIFVDAYAVYTNNLPSGAFRGFGAPQAHFACETMVTRLAQALDMDPAELRLRNLYREGSLEPTNLPLPEGVSSTPALERCLEEVRLRWGYERVSREPFRAKQPAEAHLRRGIGLACGIKNVGYSFGFQDRSTATVDLFGEAELERAEIRIGAADVGQGSQMALRQIAAEVLKLSPDNITLICDDSHEAPNAGSASASRLTFMAGRAVHDAAKQAREQWSYVDDYQARATVQYQAPATTPIDPATYTGTPNYCYGYAAQAVEVEVNLLTGQVQVLRVISVHDVGKAINMQQVTGQVEGCLAQALGYALLEHFQVQNGRVLTSHLSTYLLPTVLDMPVEITPVILELGDPHGPFGARGMAEMPLVPFAAAVAHAIHEATGVWLTQQPMTPERVLKAISMKADRERETT
ncbi:xanthine dehydrogenase family protein molybdopterin-binding subunit [Ktedonobacter racemifer]|uniref:Aldehyde oxidase and xanthine dehydrogenase molybdopterin binding n=1 Tax=Ktedonobacter racemifer DSM 44963 TaxID=485913 RepID=D6TYV1_KTERA|nr:xanthine dehydrogenase family protein molybdopterin-binding subunit [Ktedonobacter racemifer]EFH85176.1 aldehyde oxidase and xanthine dehydrogenase molybdopterin binding [Ktedonobacter racemifer DSM 44963]